MRRKQHILSLGTLVLGIVLLVSCKKDKVPAPEPSKWEVIAGQYKVYDTLGNFLYDMNIVHVPSDYSLNPDSLRFENFDGEFTYTEQQSTASNVPAYFVKIGYHAPLYDSNSKRWKIMTNADSIYNNVLTNDTIRMSFRKTNINYYIEDLVPFYECECMQIAVKQ